MFVMPGSYKEPTVFLPPPDTRSASEQLSAWGGQFAELTAAIDQERVFAKNARSDDNSLLEAYDKRIADVAAATGISLKNPMRQPGFVMPDFRMQALGVERDEIAYNKQLYQAFEDDLKGVAEKRPDAMEALRLAVPLQEDAFAISKAAQDRTEAARRNAKDLGWFAQLGAEILGTGSGMARDPLGAVSLTVGGTNALGRTMAGKILSRAVTEGAVNGGAEAVMQVASTDYQRKAGLKTDSFWTQIGLAAAFGGGLGGLAEGGGHVLKSLGRATPETDAALARVAAGDVSEADLRLLGDAAGVKLDDGDMSSLSRAMEADADTAAVMTPDVEPKLLADTVRALEEGSPLPRVVDEVDTARVPPGLRKQASPDIVQPISGAPVVAQTATPDASLAAFVDTENAARLSRLEDFVAMNEADIAHLRDDGALDAMPSERDFSNVRGASDEHRASIVLQQLEAKVAKTKAEIAAGPKHSVNDPAAQIAHAKQYGQQTVVQPELRTTKQAVPASTEAVEVAAQKLELAQVTADAVPAKPAPFKGYADTRLTGRRFHGSPVLLDGVDDFHSSALNYYGDGFYSTTAIDVADGYANRRKSATPHFYEVIEKQQVNAFDMEQPVPEWLLKGEDSDLVELAMSERPKSVRELYDEIRLWSRSEGVSADEVQDIFGSLRFRMEEQGFNAMDHLGGKITKSPDHDVRIYFEPTKQIELQPIDPAEFKAVEQPDVKPTAKAKPDDFVKRETLDILDALPGGTDAAGNPVSTTHAELTDAATRMADLADLIASCKA